MRRAIPIFLAVLGCQRASDPVGVDAGVPAPTVASPLARFEASPEIGALTRAALPFGDLRIAATSSAALETIAPNIASAPLRVSLGGGEVFAVSMRPLDARAVACAPTADRRTVVCNEAYRGVDLAIVADERHAEVFEVLRDASALEGGHARFSFALGASPGLAMIQEGERVAIRDKEGTTRFVIPAPWAVDAKGVRRDARLRLVGDRLEIDLDAQGLALPIALDPGLETATWVDKTPTARPPARMHVVGYYDSLRNKTFFVGGREGSLQVNKTTAWDGTTLTASTALPGNFEAISTAVFARKRGVGWLFGGISGGYVQDRLGEFDGAAWTFSSPSPRPTARNGVALAYDDKRDVVVLFGGVYAYSSAWTLHGDTWEHTSGGFVAKTPTNKPSPRFAAQMGYDMKRGVSVLFGGQAGGSSTTTASLNDTWEWDGTDWKKMTPTVSAPPLAGGALLWDTVGERLLLVGGNTTDTWAWDGVTWAKLTTTGFARRLEGAFAFDISRKTVVAFGGHSGNVLYETGGAVGAAYGTVYDSVVEWQVAPCTSSSECGAGSCVAGHCCATACSGSCQTCAPDGVCNTLPAGATSTDPTCLFKCGGDGSCPATCAVDGDCIAGSRCASGKCVALKPLGGVCTAGAECAGGSCVDGFCCDRPCGGACEACDVAGKLGTCTTLVKDATPHGTRKCDGAGGVCAGTCSGTSSVCSYPGSTQPCALAACVGNTLNQAGNCDGAGSCAKPGSVNCAPYLCSGTACTTSCATSADCATTGYCAFTKCLAKKAELASCTTDEECLTGACVTGACGTPVDAGPPDTGAVDTGAVDTGEVDTGAVDTGAVDTGAVDSGVTDTYVAPADTGTEDTGTPAEDAVATTPAPPFESTAVPGEFKRCSKSTECPSGFCVDGVCCNTACTDRCNSCALLTSPGICTVEPEGVDLRNECGPANSCLGTCGKGGKCIGAGSGTMCARNRCTSASTGVGPAYCPGPGAACPLDTATTFDCSPYTCEPAFGACRSMCASSNDCANGFVCDVDKKQCVAAPPPPEDDGGCALGRGQVTAAGWAFAAIAALLARRRRARADV